MSNLSEVLREISTRIGRKVSQTELGNACGVTQGHISNVVLGRQHASEELAGRIVDYLASVDSEFSYTADYLLGNAPIAIKNNAQTPIPLGNDFTAIPEVASIPCGGFEAISSEEVKEWHLVPKSLVGSAKIIVRAVGDSMSPYIIEGDLLMVEEVDMLDVQSDDVVIAEIEGEFSCKRISKSEDAIALLPDNPHYRPIFLNGQTVRIVGRVVGLHRKV